MKTKDQQTKSMSADPKEDYPCKINVRIKVNNLPWCNPNRPFYDATNMTMRCDDAKGIVDHFKVSTKGNIFHVAYTFVVITKSNDFVPAFKNIVG